MNNWKDGLGNSNFYNKKEYEQMIKELSEIERNNKRKKAKERKHDIIRSYISLVISLIALIISLLE